MGSDHLHDELESGSVGFNPRSRMGSDHLNPRRQGREARFNPRSRMGSDSPDPAPAGGHRSFNPRSRMGSDRQGMEGPIDRRVSIHAPAWGATLQDLTDEEVAKKFQSTLPHGERRHAAERQADRQCFNPRSRMGSDEPTHVCRVCPYGFNPRSRMGSDLDVPGMCGKGIRFNPRSRMGSDTTTRRFATGSSPFQSTLPHGERLA